MYRFPKVKKIIPVTNGLWSHINYEFPDIFDIDASQLDVLFASNWGMRTVAPIVMAIHDEDNEQLTDSELTTLAGIINGMYKFKWDKLMAAALTEYDPIHNFSDEVSETVEYEEQVDSSKVGGSSNSNTRTDNLTETATDGRTLTETRALAEGRSGSREDGIFGFNSDESVGSTDGSNSETVTDNGTVTTAHSGNMTTANTGTQANSGSSTYSDSEGKGTAGSKSRERSRTGNIGNISTQKLLNEEIGLWQYNFVYEIMRDVAEFITLPIYEM